MSSIKQQYHDIVHTKLEDAQLRKNLLSVMDTLKGNRKKLISTRFWIGRRCVKRASRLSKKTSLSLITC